METAGNRTISTAHYLRILAERRIRYYLGGMYGTDNEGDMNAQACVIWGN